MGLRMLFTQVSAEPSSEGLPGAEFIQTAVNWLTQIALWGALVSFLVGAAMWGLSQMAGNPYGAGQGQKLAVGGGIGAALAALADSIVNALFGAAGGVPPGT